jgi:hypothetical protein
MNTAVERNLLFNVLLLFIVIMLRDENIPGVNNGHFASILTSTRHVYIRLTRHTRPRLQRLATSVCTPTLIQG